MRRPRIFAHAVGRPLRASHGPSAQTGNAAGSLLGMLLLIAAIGFLIWRFAPEYLPGAVRMQLPRSPLDLSQDRAEAQPEAAARAATSAPAERDSNPPLYKWKDSNGVWNVTDTPPSGRSYETVRVNPDTNVLPSEAASDDSLEH